MEQPDTQMTRSSERHTFTNNSDDESTTYDSDSKDDFTSFPTLPDPEQEHSRILTKIFTKTLRKVTTNASALVQNYSSAKPHSIDEEEHEYTLEDSPVRIPTLAATHTLENVAGQGESNGDHELTSQDASKVVNVANQDSGETFSKEASSLDATPSQISAEGSSVADSKSTNIVPNRKPVNYGKFGDIPKVTSHDGSLLLSNMSIPQLLRRSTGGTVSSVVNVSAIASTDGLTLINQDPAESESTKRHAEGKLLPKDSKSSAKKTLQSRISSIFNKLPNDIELSDDSASDMETINNYSISSSPKVKVLKLSRSSSYGRARKNAHENINFLVNESPSVKRNNSARKNPSGSISSVFLDNARTIINNNITVPAVSSASSIITSTKGNKKRRRRLPKPSDNPLKTGGIPKKYWMNDEFVSDCLNCFRPFTAFRRKHHCRFCGQIFCSDCTVFVPYRKSKDHERAKDASKLPSNDKLRVCKPCYSDVIVYISESEETSDGTDSELDISSDSRLASYRDDGDASSVKLNRHRSSSVNSYNDSILTSSVQWQPKPIPPKDNQKSLLNTKTSESNIKTTNIQPPQLAIPATRKGEAVEIPVSSSSNNLANNHFGFNNFTPTPVHNHLANTDGLLGGSWRKMYSQAYSQPYSHSVGKELASNGYHSVYNSMRSKRNRKFTGFSDIQKGDKFSSRLRKGSISTNMDFSNENSDDNNYDYDDEEDYLDGAESETEDEQVMSLYTSLNHNDHTSALSSGLSPRQTSSNHGIAPSLHNVPTLGEFPTMFSNERIDSLSFNGNDSRMSMFKNGQPGNPQMDKAKTVGGGMKSMFSFLDDKNHRLTLRSHERAHASLLRMRSRRRTKPFKPIRVLNPYVNLNQEGFNNHSISMTNTHSSELAREDSRPLNQPPESLRVLSNSSTIRQEKMLENSSNLTLDGDDTNMEDRTKDYSFTLNDSYDYTNATLEQRSVVNLSNEHDASINEELQVHGLKEVYFNHINTIMDQCLNDCDIQKDRQRWKDTLFDVLKYIDFLKLTDTMDIRQYVKIKKILGGSIEETSVIDGLFFTKNIDSKKMASKIANPKIALLMFPLEYLKQKEQFISLRIVHSQQDVYINNLVSRVISLKPDIVVVGDSVCGLAEKLLEEANITVISNTKPQVIERISRYTKANIYQSINDLFFKKGSLGYCKSFEVKRYVHKNLIKTYLFFTGGDLESGFTISLRGGETSLLDSVKYTLESVMSGKINSKYERKYFENHTLRYNSDPFDETTRNRIEVPEIVEYKGKNENDEQSDIINSLQSVLDQLEVHNYSKLLSSRVLSVSPATSLRPPTFFSDVIKSYNDVARYLEIHKKIRSINDHSQIDDETISQLLFKITMDDLPNKTADYLKILEYISENHLRSLIEEFHARSRVWSNCMSLLTYQLYPIFHKSINFLHSIVSMKFATPCSGPSIVVIDFYSDNDKPMGLYLDQIFQNSLQLCTECGYPLVDHYQTYVHANGKVDLVIEKLNPNSVVADDVIHGSRMTWSCCKICNTTTPVTPMSEESYHMSIGKLFELSFWGRDVRIKNSRCEHDFFKEHIRYFSLGDQVIRMEYSDIDTYEIVVPKKQLGYVSEIDIELKLNTFKSIRNKSTQFFQSISNRLNRVKVDTFGNVEDGVKKIEELKLKLENQKSQIHESTSHIYSSTPPNVYLPLNSILRELQELGVNWDNDFNEFERNFLPSENDITKITQFHLKKFLADKYNSEDEPRADDSDHSEKIEDLTHDINNSSDKNDNSSYRKRKEGDNHANSDLESTLNIEKTKEIGKLIPSSLYQAPSISDKIHKMETLLQEEQLDRTKLPEKSSKDPKREQSSTVEALKSNTSLSNTDNKVIQLAKYFNQMNFDQISMEFKKQRERELQKKLNKFKAIPIVASKPIVEIYDNIEDVVDVNDEFDQKDKRQLALSDNNISNEGPSRHGHQVSIEFSDSKKKPYKPKEGYQPSSENVQERDFRRNEIFRGQSKNNYSKQYDLDQLKTEAKDEHFPRSAISPDEIHKNKDTEILSDLEKERRKDIEKKQIELPQPEKNSLLKSLTNFWADRSATLWDSLDYPLESNEHTFADSDVIVREDEPSSLVAFCLSSNDYKHKISLMADNTGDDLTEPLDELNKKYSNFIKIEKKFKKNSDQATDTNELEKIMTKNKSNHLKYHYMDGNTQLSCKIFYSEQFEAFRKSCGNNESFIQSLSRCIKWNSSGGKSGSNFLKTLDNRYIVKELSKSELESFVSIAPFYFKYISQSIFHTLTSAMAKIFGFYQIQIKNSVSGKTFKMDFLIMENLFYSYNTTRIFDLKGSMRNRHVKQTGKENEVLLDENMVEYIYESPVFVNEYLKRLLRGSLFNDTSFLSAMDVMDYSLIIGIDDCSKKLYIGIIDWLRTFTWDKKVENWVKGKNIIGSSKKGKDPTIITPKQYRTRFREAMERYILLVPDFWYEGR